MIEETLNVCVAYPVNLASGNDLTQFTQRLVARLARSITIRVVVKVNFVDRQRVFALCLGPMVRRGGEETY